MNKRRTIPRLAAVAALAACVTASIAFAQIDVGSFQIFQGGQVVGQIYVPVRAAGATMYAEHWVLYPNYVYPSARLTVKTDIVPLPSDPYTSEADFLSRMPTGTGYRHVTVASYDTATLPGR